MKKVTIFKSAILALLVCVGIAACDKNSDVVPDEPKTYTVNLGWAGEILDVSYEPMTRATTDDLYGIQVYSAPTNSEQTNWTPYAFGLFDDPNNVAINLLTGYKYRFVATMVKNGKDKILSNNKTAFSCPFAHFATVGTPSGTSLNNSFTYATYGFINGGIESRLGAGDSYLIINGNNYQFNHPNTDRFYGELINFIPSETNNTATIAMKRASFGAKFIAQGELAVNGILDIQIDDAPQLALPLTPNVDQISDIFTFYNVAAAWADSAHSEEIAVTLNWIRTDGSVLPLGTHNIIYKRNATTVITVNIEDDSNDKNIGFSFDDSETGSIPDDTSLNVTITNGTIIDTNVDTN